MRDGICPKCAGNEVYFQEGGRYPHEHIVLKKGQGRPDIIAVGMKVTAPDKYICADCGYLEYYVASPEDTQVVRENWQRVQAR